MQKYICTETTRRMADYACIKLWYSHENLGHLILIAVKHYIKIYLTRRFVVSVNNGFPPDIGCFKICKYLVMSFTHEY